MDQSYTHDQIPTVSYRDLCGVPKGITFCAVGAEIKSKTLQCFGAELQGPSAGADLSLSGGGFQGFKERKIENIVFRFFSHICKIRPESLLPLRRRKLIL